jgi:hypothetical protein
MHLKKIVHMTKIVRDIVPKIQKLFAYSNNVHEFQNNDHNLEKCS